MFAQLSAEPHSRELVRARSFVLAVQREIVVEMSKRSETDDPAKKLLHDAKAKGTVDALKELIAELLPDERPTIERVAPRLGMSIRTLQRRLHEWGHSSRTSSTRRGAMLRSIA